MICLNKKKLWGKSIKEGETVLDGKDPLLRWKVSAWQENSKVFLSLLPEHQADFSYMLYLSLGDWAFTSAAHSPAGLCLWNCTLLFSSRESSMWTVGGERHTVVISKWISHCIDKSAIPYFTSGNRSVIFLWTLGSYISLERGFADISEVEGQQNLPGTDVQRFVFFTEVKSGEVDDPAGWKTPGRPLPCVWRKRAKAVELFTWSYTWMSLSPPPPPPRCQKPHARYRWNRIYRISPPANRHINTSRVWSAGLNHQLL